jgi:hypothetical protein
MQKRGINIYRQKYKYYAEDACSYICAYGHLVCILRSRTDLVPVAGCGVHSVGECYTF